MTERGPSTDDCADHRARPDPIAQARAVDQRGLTGPLAGQPILIKDNIERRDAPYHRGKHRAEEQCHRPRRPPGLAPARRRGGDPRQGQFERMGQSGSNKSISGWSAVGGQTRNPFALDRNTCGSSSGSAAAIAAGIVDLAIGTETDGSITCPAAINGIVGFKPTVGLVSRTHVVPISVNQDTPGPMTRTVRQAAEVLTVIAGTDNSDRATREADARKPTMRRA